MARHCQNKAEVLFKKIILGGPLGKTNHDTIHIKFQERSCPHIFKMNLASLNL